MKVKDMSVFTLTENWNTDEQIHRLRVEISALRKHLDEVRNGRVMRVLRMTESLVNRVNHTRNRMFNGRK
jgi:hypothetical protein